MAGFDAGGAIHSFREIAALLVVAKAEHLRYKDLITNPIMLQNVVDMTDVLHDMAQEGYEVTTDVVATFTLISGNISSDLGNSD